MTRLTLKERQRQVREEAILEAAHEFLAEQGYEAMNMDDLAARIGISKATLYQHFASKEELVVSVLVQILRLAEQDIQEESAPALPAMQRLESVLRRSLKRRMVLWNANLTTLSFNKTHHPEYKKHFGYMTEAIGSLIDTAKAEGDIDPAISTAVLVRMVLWLFRTDFEDLLAAGKCTPDELINTVVAVVINGCKVRNA